MSWQAVREVLELSESRGAVRNVLLVLAEHAHDDGTESYPGYDTIQAEANVGRGTIRPALETLMQLGEIQPRGRRRSGTAKWAVTVARPGSTFELPDGSTVELGEVDPGSTSENGSSRDRESGSRNGGSSSALEHEPFGTSMESPLEPGPQISGNGNGNPAQLKSPPPADPIADELLQREQDLRELRGDLEAGRGFRGHTEQAIADAEAEIARLNEQTEPGVLA